MCKRERDDKSTRADEIRISPVAIARVAHDAALQSYGVVGMSDPWFESVRRALTHKDAPGVRVRVRKGQVFIDLYVIVQYGTRISEVAQGVMSRVKYALEHMLGVSIAEINVHVQDVRVNHEEPGGSNA